MLKLRVITALIIAPLILLAIFSVPHPVTAAVLGVLVVLGAWEWSAFAGFKGSSARLVYTVLMGAATGALWQFGVDEPQFDLILLAAVAWWALALLWIAFFPVHSNRSVTVLAGPLVLLPAWLALVRLHAHGPAPDGPQLMLFVLLLVVAADVGAYFAGRAFGQYKLAPRVSPGKTWEGVAGGLIGGSVLALAGAFWFELQWLPFVLLCVFVVLVSVLGDLTESLFKRHAGVKDSGSLLPGHGGILDRIDSLTAAGPFFLLGMQYLGLLR
jgi:phosphatidate cytidylyltransferase